MVAWSCNPITQEGEYGELRVILTYSVVGKEGKGKGREEEREGGSCNQNS